MHSRFSDFGGPANWIAADILRIVDGALVEHWDENRARHQQHSRAGAGTSTQSSPLNDEVAIGGDLRRSHTSTEHTTQLLNPVQQFAAAAPKIFPATGTPAVMPITEFLTAFVPMYSIRKTSSNFLWLIRRRQRSERDRRRNALPRPWTCARKGRGCGSSQPCG